MGILKGMVANIQSKKFAKVEGELVAAMVARKVAKAKLMMSKERAAEERSSTITEAKLKIMEENKASRAFEAEIVEGSALAFAMRFDLCNAQVVWFFPKVDVGHLNPKESKDEVEKDGANVGAISLTELRMDEVEDGRIDIAPILTTLLEMNPEDDAKKDGANIGSTLATTPTTEPITTINASIDHQP
ncbi:hypothetical protein COCNU_11G001260 [Cocos nucifera]|uniref:Uncharacterized protein n=1 Tax=Cocos nucifera TaxID=13894 RepID=A0A8K0IPN9_COCNU|nr:hypothetical protein COCNU_11G001260 [Cocos nucifera]